MRSYLVRWEVEVDAESPELALDAACQMLPVCGNETLATYFAVSEISSVVTCDAQDSPQMIKPTMIDTKEQ